MSAPVVRVECAGQGRLTIASGGTADARYRFAISSTIVPEFSLPAARDLLRVGQAAFLADRAFRRSLRLGLRTRDFLVTVPVEEPERWAKLEHRIDSLAAFVSHDRWHFEFPRLRPPAGKRVNRKVTRNACVSLFSGGLDSLCGAAAAYGRGDTPIFVTHSPPGAERVATVVGKLRKELCVDGLGPEFVAFQFQANSRTSDGARSLFPERTRRTRPMLYLCMAGAVALECRVPRIYLNENGVLAINLPFQPHLNGPLVSRHAHPGTLRRFQTLLSELWDGREEPVVINPFAGQTKGEQMSSLGAARVLAPDTISCEYAGQQVARLIAWLRDRRRPYRDVRECGLCFPCLVRQAAMRVAGVAENPNHYAFNVSRAMQAANPYRDYPLYSVVQRNARYLHDFCETVASMDPCEFVLRYAAPLALASEDGDAIGRPVFELYQRFANEVRAIVGE